jgi:antitoxin CcdA
MPLSRRKPTTISLRRDLLEQAKSLGVNVAGAAEAGLVAAVKAERVRRWQTENAASIRSYNSYLAEQGLPLGAQD